MWTGTTRKQYRRDHLSYASNMTDAEWLLFSFFLPAPRHLGRPREIDLRAVMNAVLYLLSTGCQWRMLPKDFPPRSTVQYYFYPAKRVKGRKRHMVTDTQGFPLALLVHEANIQDNHGAVPLLRLLRQIFPKLRHIFADRVYRGAKLRDAIAEFGKWTIEIVTRSERVGTFKPEPKRWVIERTFAWLGRNRRLAKDFETTIESAEAWCLIASVQLLSRRLART